MSPQLYDDSARRRRKGGTGAQQGPSSQPVAALPAPREHEPLGTAHRESGGTLPTGLTWEVAGLKEPNRIRRAARLLARDIDITPRYLFGKTDLSGYEDPIHGGRMRGSTIRRLTEDFAPQILADMLRNVSTGTTDAMQRREVGGRAPVDPVRVARHARALEMHLRDQLDASTLIGIAANLERKGVDPKRFDQNLMRVQEWIRQTAQDLDWQAAVSIAMRASQAKVTLNTNFDVVKYLSPPEVQRSIAEAEAIQEQRRTNQIGSVV